MLNQDKEKLEDLRAQLEEIKKENPEKYLEFLKILYSGVRDINDLLKTVRRS